MVREEAAAVISYDFGKQQRWCGQQCNACYCLQDAAKAVDKVPNESQIGCYTISLLALKATIERQRRGIHEELLNSLRRKVINLQYVCTSS